MTMTEVGSPTDRARHAKRTPVDGVAQFIARYRWQLVIMWVIVMTLGALGAVGLSGKMSGGGWSVPGSSSAESTQAVRQGFVGRGDSTVALVVTDHQYTAQAPQFEDRVKAVLDDVTRDPRLDVRSAFGWATLSSLNRSQFLGKDRRTVVTSLGLNIDEDTVENNVPLVQEDLTRRYTDEGISAQLVSAAAFRGEVGVVSKDRLIRAEIVTLPILAVVLLLLFRGVAAALASFAVGVTSVVLTLGVLSPIADSTTISVFVENIVTMLGLGVGIDYSLLMIKRFKEELAAGRSPVESVAATLRSAGHTVIVSGVTIMLAMSTLFLVQLTAILSITIGAVIVVGMSVLAAITILPVLLMILGPRINSGAVPLPKWWRTEESGDDNAISQRRWYRFVDRVMDRPVVAVVLTGAVLLGVSVPALDLRIFTPDVQILPQSTGVRSGYDAIEQQFGTGAPAPIKVVVRAPDLLADPGQGARIAGLVAKLRAVDGADTVRSALDVLQLVSPADPFGALSPASFDALPIDAQNGIRYYVADDRRTTIIEVVPRERPSDLRTHALLQSVRELTSELDSGFQVWIGGETADGADTNKVIIDSLPLVLVVMLLIIFVVLAISFRSILLPLKAVAMNLLSVSATFGLLVLGFQRGVGADLLGLDDRGYLMFFVPVLLLALLFSLSTDYEVFVLSRVREEYLRHGDNRLAVLRGLTRTAPLITGAALLMIVVFVAFGITGIMPTQQLGLGLAIGVAIDATIVRALMVPATMRLMGRWNWWLPFSRSARQPSTNLTKAPASVGGKPSR